jgi:pimeloyl-ACP methyl ester carboxylesterase
MTGIRVQGRAALLGAALAIACCCGSAQAITYAPLNKPGPPLSVPAKLLKQALVCTAGVASGAKEPLLLVPGTTVNPTEFTWNWERALTALNWPYCTIDLPGNAMGDIQVAGEYIVYAIRTIHSLSGRRVDILGHSQGGMVPRWALRFWPDTRPLVDDMIGMAPSNHGTPDAGALCAVGGCAPAIWQQRRRAAFIAAINSYAETFAGISYTDIYTRTDEVVVPNLSSRGASSLHTGGGQIANVAIQQVCPIDVTEHLGIGTYDDTAYAIVLDALTHGGPADPSRVSRSVCLSPLMPGVDPLTFATDYAGTGQLVGTTLATYPHVSKEPALACYVTASCHGSRSH